MRGFATPEPLDRRDPPARAGATSRMPKGDKILELFTIKKVSFVEVSADVMLLRGIPEHIRSDNGPEFIAGELRN